MKIAIIAGHNAFKQQGKWVGDISENKFWNEFIEELLRFHILPYMRDKPDLLVRWFHRPDKPYHEAMRRLHAEIDEWGADIDVEMHFNASASEARGHEVLHYRKSEGGAHIASIMDKAFDDNLNNRDRGLKPVGVNESGGYGLFVGKSKSILTEAFFAKELQYYVVGGSQRPALIKAYMQFIDSVLKN